jgi:endo-1,4-beta-xylanase
MTSGLSRRDTLRVIGGLTACFGLGTGPSRAGTDLEAIGAAAEHAGIVFGTSIAADTLEKPAQAELYRRHARILTADWALKFNVMRPEAGLFETRWADEVLAFADGAGLPLRGHTLAWNETKPDWLMALSTAERRAIFDRHIDETAGRYAGRLHSWDVVNEPFWPGHGIDGGWRDGPWLDAFGTDYVERAFRRAAAADPGCRLVLNEAHTEQWTETGAGIRAGLLGLIERLQDAGVRLDAVGLQGHLQPQWDYDDAGFADFLWKIADRGVDIYITELDVNDERYPDDPLIRDAAVADRYEAFLGAVLAVPAVKMVVTWQLTDAATFYIDWWRQMHPGSERRPRPLPFDDALQPKAAYDALMAAFRNRRSG